MSAHIGATARSAEPSARLRTVVRAVRWTTLAVVATEVVLLAGGRIDLGVAAALLVVVEVVLGGVVLTVAWRAARDGVHGDRLAAVVRTLLPRPVAALVELELGQARSLWLLVRGRVHTESPDDVVVPYAAGRGGIYGMLVAACAIELAVVHLAVPWHRLGGWAWLQWLVLVLSAYAAVWILAWWAAQRTHPHLVTRQELVLRNGTLVALRVPLEDVVGATPRRRGAEAEDRLCLGGPGGDTNLDVDLARPVTWRSATGRRGRQVAGVALAVDDPREAAHRIDAAARHA